MRINIGSTNQVKIDAVKETILDYDFFANSEIHGLEVASGVYKQPKTLEETIRGAMNRANGAFQNCDYSFGIESGLFNVPNAKTGYMNTCACAIFDGMEYYLGLAPCFEYPQDVMDLVLNEGLEINEAVHKLGYTNNPKIGSAEGFIYLLSNGMITRKEYVKQAIIMALINLENRLMDSLVVA